MTEYPPTRVYRTRVARIARLTPHFTRVTVRDRELRHFGTAGLDQRIKLLFPPAGGAIPEIGVFDEPISEWYGRWRLLPDAERGAMRTYTVRGIHPEAEEIDIDFVLHGIDGPASAWASGARPGDELVVLGPDGRSEASGGGVEWGPGSARSVLIAGDETAVPAIAAILESFDDTFSGSVCIEVPEAGDILDLRAPAGVEVVWLFRDGAAHGALLDPAVRLRAKTLREARDPYAWLAGEAGVVTSLRRHLVREVGVDRRSVAFMGYWKRGKSEPN